MLSKNVVDYIIVMTDKYFKEIVSEAVGLGVDRRKLLKGSVLSIPHFEWDKYIGVYESNISLVSPTCVGGVLLNKLGLPFLTPFINLRIGMNSYDFYRLIERLEYYLKTNPSNCLPDKYKESDMIGIEGRMDYPMLWYEDICIHGFHYSSVDKFLEVFDIRRKRFNYDNWIVFKPIFNESELDYFRNLKLSNVIGVFYRKVDDKNVLYFPWDDQAIRDYAYGYNAYLDEMIRNGSFFGMNDIFSALDEVVQRNGDGE